MPSCPAVLAGRGVRGSHRATNESGMQGTRMVGTVARLTVTSSANRSWQKRRTLSALLKPRLLASEFAVAGSVGEAPGEVRKGLLKKKDVAYFESELVLPSRLLTFGSDSSGTSQESALCTCPHISKNASLKGSCFTGRYNKFAGILGLLK